MDFFGDVEEVVRWGDDHPLGVDAQPAGKGNEGAENFGHTAAHGGAVDVKYAGAGKLAGSGLDALGKLRVKNFGVGSEGLGGKVYGVEQGCNSP